MLLLSAGGGLLEYRTERERAGQRQMQVARSMAATVERELAGAVGSLQALALSPALQTGDLAGFRALAMRLMATQPEGAALVLLDSSGQHLVNTLFAPGDKLLRRTASVNAALTTPVFQSGKPVISNVFPRALNGALIVTADVPVLVGGHVGYDLSLVLPASRFTQIIAGQHLDPGTISSVFDRNGVHVARLPDAARFVGVPVGPRLRAALGSRAEGVVASVAPDGTRLLTAFSHTEPSGWSVTIAVPEAVLAARLRTSVTLLLGAGLLGLGCSLALAAVLARRVLVPMRTLALFAADPARDPAPGAFDLRELEAVADALRHSMAERQSALEALRALNAGLETRVRHEIASREQAQAQLAQSQRMEALGQLAGGIAHDFNNVLQAVIGGLSLIQRRADDPAAVRRLSGLAADAAGRGAAITGRLLTFARRGDLQGVAIAPCALLEGMRQILAPTLGAGIAVSVEAAPDLPSLLADRAQLETVLVNLAINARDAMQGGGALSLAAAAARDDEHRALKPGGYIKLVLSDTGTGMDDATLARATEPFFTTKRPGHGTGLGLAMARGFAEQSGGALRLDSTPGAGTIVTLWFPQAPAGAARETGAQAAACGSDKAVLRVLMVDDDSMVREVLAHELEDRGFVVTTAADGAAGLALIEGGCAADLLVSDYAMPGMNGLAVIAAARGLRPELPCILLTGYAEAETALTMAQDRRTMLLRKPISGAALARCAAELCEAGRATAGAASR